MMLLDVVRKLVPIRYRQSLGLWSAHQASRSRLTLYPYLFLLCGAIPKNLIMLPSDECAVDYKGNRIVFPRDGVFTSWEVLQDEIYERVYSPKVGDVVIDIGAYTGMFTVKMSLQVGETGKVIAIEPSSTNLKYLCKNAIHLPNVQVIPIAVGSSRKSGELTISEASPCHTLLPKTNSSTEPIQVDTLDNILSGHNAKKVDFIKIDAEGSELEILKGATNTLRNNKLRVAVASYHNLPNGEYELPYIQMFFSRLGFRVITIKEYVYADNLEIR